MPELYDNTRLAELLLDLLRLRDRRPTIDFGLGRGQGAGALSVNL